MPIYEYACSECNNLSEVIHKPDEKVRVKCDKCGKLMKRKLSAPCPPRFGRGTPGSASEAEWAARQQAQLQKRSEDHNASPAGKEEREIAVDRLKKNGMVP